MEDKKIIDDYSDKSEGEELDIETSEETQIGGEDIAAKDQEIMLSRAMSSADTQLFSDEKQYPEDPFSYFETNKVHVELSSGNFQYEVTDFVLPGRDGFDVSIARRYDSGRANLVDMDSNMSVTGNRTNITTSSKDNSYNNRTYGLGYGWSFILPSIETVSYKKYLDGWTSNGEPIIKQYTAESFILHLEDGRSLKINGNTFDDYTLADVTIDWGSGKIQHRYAGNIEKEYDITIGYKNGNKDYFKYESRVITGNIREYGPDYKLVAREDKFGNVIFYNLKGPEGMEIIDTWGRTLKLQKTDSGFTWILPGANSQETYNLFYQMDRTSSSKLKVVKNQIGSETKYDYYNEGDYTGKMMLASKAYAGNSTGEKPRPYLLLKEVTYPNHAKTQFEYGTKFDIENESGGYISKFPLFVRKDIVKESVYHRTEYSFEHSGLSKPEYVKNATVSKHGADIIETYQFDKDGQMLEKKVKNQNVLISNSAYGYDKDHKHLRISAVDQVFDNNKTNMLEKTTSWNYSNDKKANMIQEIVEYTGDSASNQEINIAYNDYSMVKETTRKKDGNITIKETNDYSKYLIKCHRVYEVDKSSGKTVESLKEKTVFEYKDTNNPNCVTNEKRYFLTDNGNLEQSNKFIETFYEYDSNKCTHNFVIKEQKEINDVDGKSSGSIKETLDYDKWGRIISKKDPRGQESKFYYDNLGRVVKEELPSISGQPVSNQTTYNDKDIYITKTDANDQKTRIQYTPLGRVLEVYLATADQPAAGDILLKKYQYNTWGELENVNTYDGNGEADSCVRKTERYTYDSFGRVLTRTIPQVGYEENYSYDEVFVDPTDGKKYYHEQKTVRGDSSAPDMVTEVYKDQKGQIRKQFLAGTRMVTYEYDKAGNNIKKTDALNKAEKYEYDYAGRVVKSIRTDAGQERIVRVEYDALGNKRFNWDETGNKTEFQYDAAGRLIQVIAPFDHRKQYIKNYYDAGGNVTCERKKQDNGWLETQNVYDARSRLTDTYQYLSSTNWIRTRYQYDAMDRMTQMRTGDIPAGDGVQVTKYTYDRFGNIVKMTDARGCTEYCQYDKAGRLQKKTDHNGNQTVYQYDALERPVKETASSRTADGVLNSEREYDYGKNGQRIREASRETLEGNQTVFLETKYRYNNKGQLICQEDPGNAVKDYTYDILGNRLSFQLTRQGQAVPDINLYYSYDDLYRLKQVRKNSADGMVLAEYEYDERGNRKTLRYPQAGIETRYSYNDAGRVTFLENKRSGTVISTWEYSYDVDGNMVSKTDKTGSTPNTISYRYDRLGRLAEEDYPGWKRTFYTYDAYSNRIKMMVEGKKKNEPVSVTSYEYGLNNWLSKEIRKQGKVTETWQYRYDDNGNETFRIWEKTAPKPDYPGKVNLSGEWKREVPTVYERRHYNGFHQLIRINQDDKEITYQYRGDGMRHSSEVRKLNESQSKTNVCYWDGTDIVAEQADGGTVKRYLRGINLIAREMDGVLYFYIINEHGDVAQVWGQSGTCKVSYEYDAFGNEKNTYKEDNNPFRYCGEYLDLSSSTYYLRARNYRSATGRFLTEDPIKDGLNWYAYCENNPQKFIDPTGCTKEIQDWFWREQYKSANRVAKQYWNKAVEGVQDFGEVILDVVEIEVECGIGVGIETGQAGVKVGISSKLYKKWDVTDMVFTQEQYIAPTETEEFKIGVEFSNKLKAEAGVRDGEHYTQFGFDKLEKGEDLTLSLWSISFYNPIYAAYSGAQAPGGGVDVKINLTKAEEHLTRFLEGIIK